MWWLALGGLALVLAMTKKKGGDYIDQNGIHWRIYEQMPDFWCAETEGYGGKWPPGSGSCGFVSYNQAVEIIEGNAANRDPKTGALL